jgi:hypothetical protein
MYRHNPASPSIVAWRKRYVMAYRHVAHQPAPDNVNGSVKIWSSSNRPLDVRDLGGPQHYAAGQALAVRNYIAANGCLMVITLSDTPAINTTSTGMKERLVEFDIGVQGSGKRVRAYQYIKFNQKLSSAAWTRDFGRHASPIHLKPGPREVRVEPPVGVALARVATPFATYGEYD